MSTTRIPVALLTGFLGSGKTTLLNAWLRDPALSDAAVIVNEFGEVGIDHNLIAASNDNTIELSTGCLCCTVRGDLVETLRDLAEKRACGLVPAFTRVVIETTGLADPAPVIQALMSFPVSLAYRLGRIITVVDGVQGETTLGRHREAVKQAAVADVLVLSKTDLPSRGIDALATRLSALNPGALQHRGPAPTSILDGDGVYDFAFDTPAHHHAHAPAHDGNRHDAEIGSFSFTFNEPLAWEHVATWLDAMVTCHGPDLLRVKGIMDIANRSRPIVVQAVQRLFSPPVALDAWPSTQRQSQIVFITRNITKDYVAEVFRIIRTRRLAA